MENARANPDGAISLHEICGSEHAWSSLRDLAADYWRCQRLPSRRKDADMAAWECVEDLVTEPAWPRALELIDLLIELATEDEIGLIAAGPLEDLIRDDRARRFTAQIEARARQDATFRRAVSGVWLDRDASPEVNRMLAVFGARFPDGSVPD